MRVRRAAVGTASTSAAAVRTVSSSAGADGSTAASKVCLRRSGVTPQGAALSPRLDRRAARLTAGPSFRAGHEVDVTPEPAFRRAGHQQSCRAAARSGDAAATQDGGQPARPGGRRDQLAAVGRPACSPQRLFCPTSGRKGRPSDRFLPGRPYAFAAVWRPAAPRTADCWTRSGPPLTTTAPRPPPSRFPASSRPVSRCAGA